MAENNGSDEASNSRLVARAWEESNARNTDGAYVTDVAGIEIRIGHIEHGSDETVEWVDVWMGPRNGSPDMRIINPEIFVADRNGDTEREQSSASGVVKKVRFRLDPVRAVAETIASVRSGT